MMPLMAIAVTETSLTAEEFFHLPDPPEGGKLELICGKVVHEMPVSGKHGKRQVRISSALDAFIGGRVAEVTVETGFVLRQKPALVLAPDVAVTPRDRLPDGELPEEGFVEGPPLLAVEVASPNDPEADLMAKVGHYLDAGVDRVWVVQARNQTVTVFSQSGEIRQLGVGATLTSADAGFAEEGFSLPVASLFE